MANTMPNKTARNATFPVARHSNSAPHLRHKHSIYGYGNYGYGSYGHRSYGYGTYGYGSSSSRYASRRINNAPRYSTAASSQITVRPPVTSPPLSIFGAAYGSEPWELSRMGDDWYQIRQFIQKDAREKRIHPNQFDKERFKRAIVQINNRYRWMHGTDGLVPDSFSEVGAARWADGLARSGSCLVHELRHGGENLFYFASTEPFLSTPETMAEAVMKSFYIEGRNYMRYAFPASPDPNAYHYTQMLWRGSRRIGVGVSIQALSSGAGPCVPYAYGYGYNRPQAWMFYVDIRYDPIGNQAYPGNGYTENVLPLMRRV
ncbi:hypothetical protein niasHT_007139 [Heterodera trifolii]|uniref:SCP domain-containing protein n=1 Tax=Heterodera trifolii TaxID=157864 RepID=A0ABD2LND1_9BILA